MGREGQPLHAHENDLRGLLETAAEGIIAIDAQGTITAFNLAAERIFHYTAADVIGQTVSLLLPSLSTGEKMTLGRSQEIVGRRKDGTLFPVEIAVSAFSVKGRPCFSGIVRDITEHKQAEATLKKNQTQLMTFIQSMPVSVAMLDRNLHYLATSDRWRLEFSRGYSDLIGRNHYDVHPDLPPAWRPIHQQCLAGASLKHEEDLWIQADGNPYWLRWAITPWKDEQGDIGGIIIFTENITERIQAEIALRESETQLRGILETASEGIIAIDAQGIITAFNPAAERIFHYPAADAIGQNVSLLMPSPCREEHDGYLTRYLNTGEKRIIGIGREVVGRRKDDTVFPMEIAVSEFSVKGRPCFSGIVRDISARKQAEQQLHAQASRLRELTAHLERVREEEREELARELHDELGAMFTVLKMNLEQLQALIGGYSEDVASKLRHTNDIVMNAVQLSRRIINTLRPSALDLGLWVAIEWQATELRKLDIACEVLIEENVYEREPMGERAAMIFRIVQESLTNIVRHAQASKVRIHCQKQDKRLVIAITDNGRGIHEADLKKRHHWGILGMQERARAWHGEVQITGSSGHGTTVRLTLLIEE